MSTNGAPTDNPQSNNVMSSSTLHDVTNIGSLKDKVALITGGSSGLGRAISQAYAAAGAFVVSADITPDPPKVEALAKTLKDTDLTTPTVDIVNSQQSKRDGKDVAAFTKCDVTDEQSVKDAVKFAVDRYGRLDIMVNNAGVAHNPNKPFSNIHETDVESWDRIMGVNGKGVWLGMKAAINQFLAQPAHSSGDKGWIVNICSICGLVGVVGASAYCASKGAVLLMTKTVALEYAKDRIHVNCINPGFTETHMLEPLFNGDHGQNMKDHIRNLHPWGRLGLAEDMARAAVFLAGPGAGWMTGHALVVDGGYTAQ